MEERLLRVNSRYRQPNGTNTNFTYIFDQRLVDRATSISLMSASFPKMFGNIYAPNNVISYLVGVVPTTFTIPNGQYTATELAAVINTCIDFGCTYDLVTHRFEFTFTIAPGDVLLLNTSSIATEIGLTQNILLIPAGIVQAASPPQLSGPCQVYLESNFLASVNAIDTPQLSIYIPLVATIPCAATPYGFCVNYLQSHEGQGKVVFNDLISLRSIDFQLTDERGFVLPLSANQMVDLVFKFQYAIDD